MVFCLLMVLFATAIEAQSPEPAPPDWEAIEALIAAASLDEAFQRLSKIDRHKLDAGGHEKSAELFDEIASRAGTNGNRQLAVNALIGLANAQSELALYRAAEATLERAEALWRQDPDPAQGVDLWSAHAFRLNYQRQPAAALEYSRRALDLARELGDMSRVRNLLVSRGQAQLQVHEYANALDSFNEALGLEVEDARRIITVASLGIAHFELNQWDEAERIFLQARDMAAESGNRRIEAWAIGELATTYARQGRETTLALELFDQSIAAFAELGDIRNEVIFRGNRGSLLRDVERYPEALSTFLEAEDRLRGIEGQPPNPIVTKNIGDCLAALERLEAAEGRFRQAIEQAEAAGHGKAHWQAARGLAGTLRRQGRFGEADSAYRQALDVIETMRGTLRLESFKTDFFEDKIEVYEQYVDFLVTDSREPQREQRAFEIAERARARGFLDTLAETRANLHETLPQEVLDEESELLGAIAEIQSKIQREGTTGEFQRELDRAEAELDALYLRVRQTLPRFRDIRYPQPAGLAQIQRLLQPTERLVQYFLGEPRSHMWIVSHRDIRWHALPGRSEVDAAVRAVYGRMVDPTREPQNLDDLANWLLAPLAEQMESDISLLIVPSGSLFYLPLDILPWGAPGKTLADAATTAYLPSASTLVALREGAEPALGVRLLAVGDPSYPAPDPSLTASQRPGATGRLPHTRTEVSDLARRFGAHNATLLLGEVATEARFKHEAAPGFSVVHIATHGRVEADHPDRSALLFADPPGGAEDGLLQIREIYRLPLEAELVTLSACRSAMGELTTGEGMIGLSRAFQFAGADSIVASLWTVDDEAAAEFMALFYDHLEGGAGKAEALRRARLDLRQSEQYRHPYYWAAYVLIGEGSDGVRFPPQTEARRTWAIVLVGMLVVAVLGWRVLRGRRNQPTFM